jgi:prepilin signal peptidase PulO-like enzyme (type II secretory pathway)
MPPAPLPSWQAVFPWAETAIIGCGFLWGAMFGSFLNVVAHRVPRGASVVRGRSRCPRCGAPVRPRDNVPVLGWLLLRGRCRDCAAPIAARYPLVEAACGLIVAGLAAFDLVWGGVDRMLLHGDVLPWGRFALHVAVALVAVAWGLLAAAGTRCPAWLPLLGAAAGFVVVAVPALQPIGVLPDGTAWPAGRPRQAALAAWLAGSIAGGIAHAAVRGPGRGPLPLLGAVFGWQVVTVVTAVIGFVRRVRRTAGAGTPADG